MRKWLTAKRHKELLVGGDRVSKVNVFWGVLLKSSGGLGRVQRKVGRLDEDRISLRGSHFWQTKWICSSNSKSIMEVPGSLVKIWKMKKSETMWCALRRILPKVIADQLFCTRNAWSEWEPDLWIQFSWWLQTHNLLPWYLHKANDCPSLFPTSIPVKTVCPVSYGANTESVHYEAITTDMRKISSSSSYLCFNSLKCFSFI